MFINNKTLFLLYNKIKHFIILLISVKQSLYLFKNMTTFTINEILN
jgi:hypothetical protein